MKKKPIIIGKVLKKESEKIFSKTRCIETNDNLDLIIIY